MKRNLYGPLRQEVAEGIKRFVEQAKQREADMVWRGYVGVDIKRRLFGTRQVIQHQVLRAWVIPGFTAEAGERQVPIYAAENGGLLVTYHWYQLPAFWSLNRSVKEKDSLLWKSVFDPKLPVKALTETKKALDRNLSNK